MPVAAWRLGKLTLHRGSTVRWLDEALESPLGKLALLFLGLAARLAFGYLQRTQERKRKPPEPSSPKA